MAKIKLSRGYESLHGKLGGFVIRQSSSGEHYMSVAPDMSEVKWSAAQKAHRQKFREAVAYARAALADPQARVYYRERAAQEKKRPYNLALSDGFKGIDPLKKAGRGND
jgi:hypothetical protein